MQRSIPWLSRMHAEPDPAVLGSRASALTRFTGLAALTLLLLFAMGCAPKLAIQAPKEPIVINMNIKVEHEIRVNVDQDLEALFEDEKEIF